MDTQNKTINKRLESYMGCGCKRDDVEPYHHCCRLAGVGIKDGISFVADRLESGHLLVLIMLVFVIWLECEWCLVA